jgi:hypothetical protein
MKDKILTLLMACFILCLPAHGQINEKSWNNFYIYNDQGQKLASQGNNSESLKLFDSKVPKEKPLGIIYGVPLITLIFAIIYFYKNKFLKMKRPSEAEVDKLSIDQVFVNFQSIRNPLSYAFFWLLPWVSLALLLIPMLIGDKDIMELSLFAMVAIYSLIFNHSMSILPESFRTIWKRGLISSKSVVQSTDDNLEIDEHLSISSEVSTKLTETDYKNFIKNFEKRLNYLPGELALGSLFALGGALAGYWYFFVVLAADYRTDNTIKDFINIIVLGNEPVWRISLESYLRISTLIYCLIGLIVGFSAWRLFVTSWYIRSLADSFDIEPKLNHPDNCCGLSPLGNLCLMNALIAGIFASYFGIWIIVIETLAIYRWEYAFWYDFFAYIFALTIIIAPLAFFWPIWNIHLILIDKRRRIMEELDYLGQRIDHMECNLLYRVDEFDLDKSKKLMEDMDIAKKLYEQNNAFPKWPFEPIILKKFVFSLVIPFLAVTHIGEWILNKILIYFGSVHP